MYSIFTKNVLNIRWSSQCWKAPAGTTTCTTQYALISLHLGSGLTLSPATLALSWDLKNRVNIQRFASIIIIIIIIIITIIIIIIIIIIITIIIITNIIIIITL